MATTPKLLGLLLVVKFLVLYLCLQPVSKIILASLYCDNVDLYKDIRFFPNLLIWCVKIGYIFIAPSLKRRVTLPIGWLIPNYLYVTMSCTELASTLVYSSLYVTVIAIYSDRSSVLTHKALRATRLSATSFVRGALLPLAVASQARRRICI